ncbi:MAG: response regulator [Rhodospirillales bacterium]
MDGNAPNHVGHDAPCVMVIDDQPAMRAIIGRLLHQQGLGNVIEAENGLHAIRLLGGGKVAKPDVIICDLYMDEMDGMEFVEQLRRHRNQTPVLILTAEKNAAMHDLALQAGANKVLTKPISAASLGNEVTVALAEHAVATEVARSAGAAG